MMGVLTLLICSDQSSGIPEEGGETNKRGWGSLGGGVSIVRASLGGYIITFCCSESTGFYYITIIHY